MPIHPQPSTVAGGIRLHLEEGELRRPSYLRVDQTYTAHRTLFKSYDRKRPAGYHRLQKSSLKQVVKELVACGAYPNGLGNKSKSLRPAHLTTPDFESHTSVRPTVDSYSPLFRPTMQPSTRSSQVVSPGMRSGRWAERPLPGSWNSSSQVGRSRYGTIARNEPLDRTRRNTRSEGKIYWTALAVFCGINFCLLVLRFIDWL